MAEDNNMKRTDAELEEYGVWIKAGQDEDSTEWDLDSDENDLSGGDNTDYYLTDEEEQILSHLEEDSLPDFGDAEQSFADDSDDDFFPSDTPDSPAAPSKSDAVLLQKIEGELELLRQEIRDLRKELSVARRSPDSLSGDDSGESETAAGGFFDQDSGDETIALTGDELENILGDEEPGYPAGDASLDSEEVSRLIDPVTPGEPPSEEIMVLPEDEYLDGEELIRDTSLDADFSLEDEDPGISLLSSEDTLPDDLLQDDDEESTLELHIPESDDDSDSVIDLDVSGDGELVTSEVSLDDDVLTIDDFPADEQDLSGKPDEPSEIPRLVEEVVTGSQETAEEGDFLLSGGEDVEIDLDIDSSPADQEVALDLEDSEPAFVLPDEAEMQLSEDEVTFSNADEAADMSASLSSDEEEISLDDFITSDEPDSAEEKAQSDSSTEAEGFEEMNIEDFTEVNLDDLMGDSDSSVAAAPEGAAKGDESSSDDVDDNEDVPYDEGEEVDFDLEGDDETLELEPETSSDGSEEVDLSDFGFDTEEDDSADEETEEIDLSEFGIEEVSEDEFSSEDNAPEASAVETETMTSDAESAVTEEPSSEAMEEPLAQDMDLEDGEISMDMEELTEELDDPLSGLEIEDEELSIDLDSLDLPEEETSLTPQEEDEISLDLDDDDDAPVFDLEEEVSFDLSDEAEALEKIPSTGAADKQEKIPEPDMEKESPVFELEDEEISLNLDDDDDGLPDLDLEDQEITLDLDGEPEAAPASDDSITLDELSLEDDIELETEIPDDEELAEISLEDDIVLEPEDISDEDLAEISLEEEISLEPEESDSSADIEVDELEEITLDLDESSGTAARADNIEEIDLNILDEEEPSVAIEETEEEILSLEEEDFDNLDEESDTLPDIEEVDISALPDEEEPEELELGEETLADLDDRLEDEAIADSIDLDLQEDDLDTSPIAALRNVKDKALEDLPYDVKKELKEVLIYMDQLLEALPENKIKEFARSEHFEVYKKIFEELGIEK